MDELDVRHIYESETIPKTKMRFRYTPNCLRLVALIGLGFVTTTCKRSDSGSQNEQRREQSISVDYKFIERKDVVGAWRGFATGYKQATKQERWYLYRRLDGTLLMERYYVNNRRNIYAVIMFTEGTWTIERSRITQRMTDMEPTVLYNVHHRDENTLTWNVVGPQGPWYNERSFFEVRVTENFTSGPEMVFGKADADKFKRVSVDEFEEIERDDDPPIKTQDSRR